MEARNGRLCSRVVYYIECNGNKACLTVRPTGQTGTKVGHSDPIIPNGRVIAQRIKGTQGITGWSCPRVHIDDMVRHLDVGLAYPGAVAGPKGRTVRPLRCFTSWVQNDVSQFGPYLSLAF